MNKKFLSFNPYKKIKLERYFVWLLVHLLKCENYNTKGGWYNPFMCSIYPYIELYNILCAHICASL